MCQTRLKLSCKVNECKPLPPPLPLSLPSPPPPSPPPSPHSRGLHATTFRLNVSAFCCIYVECMIPPQSIRQGDTGRCDHNDLG